MPPESRCGAQAASCPGLWDSHGESVGDAMVTQPNGPSSAKGLHHLFLMGLNEMNSMSLHCRVRGAMGRGRQTFGMIILSSHAFCLLVNKPNKMLGSNSICHASHIRIIQLEIESVQPPLEAVP